AGRGKEPLAAMPVPEKYKFVPSGTPAGQPYNVAQAYARATDALRGGGAFDVDFDLAVKRHKLIDAIERSSATGRSVKLDPLGRAIISVRFVLRARRGGADVVAR